VWRTSDKWPQKSGDVAAFGLVTSMLWLSEKYHVLCYIIIIITIIINFINLISHYTKFSPDSKDIIMEN